MARKSIPRPGEKATYLTFYIGRDRQRVHIRMKDKGIVIGRNTEHVPVDVDTIPFDGKERGVSRKHVLIAPKKDYFYVRDLNSVNSTWHNKVRMSPMVSEELYHGDLLHLGELRIEVYYTYEDEMQARIRITNILPAIPDDPALGETRVFEDDMTTIPSDTKKLGDKDNILKDIEGDDEAE